MVARLREITSRKAGLVRGQLRVVDLSYLRQLGPVVGVFRRVVGADAPGGRGGGCGGRRPASFLRPGHALRQQHVVQSHQLRILGLLLLGATDTEHCGGDGGDGVRTPPLNSLYRRGVITLL
ncbi:hypothetical protein EYF80_032335 [Liparis tanakae]|uniref:Uncharacterized protein n=1 Tax=Liparis tanakae TaxID=230148 RepID=A0A4Z2GUW9_9TELE|nr:hypothetical protein EYF80_032335 [Liparis tanakae]